MMSVLKNVSILAITLGAAACTAQSEKKASLPPKAPTASVEATPERATPTPTAVSESKATATGTESASESASDAPPEGKAFEYRLTGAVASTRQSQVAFRVGGFISSVTARPGMSCRKGDVLASLDDRDYILKVELARARRGLAKVTSDSAAIELEREQQLKQQNASTPTVFDKIKASHDQAQLNLKLADIELKAAEQALADTKLQAPYDCVVADQIKYEGENVQAGSPVLQIYDVVEPEIALTAPERLIGDLSVGTELSVFVPSAGFEGSAKIIRMVPIISEKTRTFQVYAKLNQANKNIVPGSYAEATTN